MTESKQQTGLSTTSIHGGKQHIQVDVVPPIGVSTTFRYSDDPEQLVPPENEACSEELVYSRIGTNNVFSIEKILSEILHGQAVSYCNGLAAFHAAVLAVNPKQIFISDGYHGVLEIVSQLSQKFGIKVLSNLTDLDKAGPGDLIHIETPVNPLGESRDLTFYTTAAKKSGALVLCDSTLAPPPLQDPFEFGVDIIMHSGTKYFGGHSDLLSGILVVRDSALHLKLLEERLLWGTIPQGLEAWLLIRSLRTLELRVKRQAENATKLVRFLVDNIERFPQLESVSHSSLQTEEFVKAQLPLGPPLFSVILKDEKSARTLPSKLKYFIHATSLGGVESLVEWRRMSDAHVSPKLVRVSVGVENIEDLTADFEQALLAL